MFHGIKCAVVSGMQNPEPRRQTPEETMNRIAGVPKTAEELEAEQKTLDEERTAQVQRNAGIYPNDQAKDRTTAQPNQPTTDPARTQSSTRSSSTSSDKA